MSSDRIHAKTSRPSCGPVPTAPSCLGRDEVPHRRGLAILFATRHLSAIRDRFLFTHWLIQSVAVPVSRVTPCGNLRRSSATQSFFRLPSPRQSHDGTVRASSHIQYFEPVPASNPGLRWRWASCCLRALGRERFPLLVQIPWGYTFRIQFRMSKSDVPLRAPYSWSLRH